MTTVEREKTSLRRRTLLAMAACVVGCGCAVRAQASADLVDLAVVDRDTGEALRVWRHRGRLFVAGEPGARYSLRVTNNTDGRVLVVMSVDGVNILTGESAGYGQRGYVFGPYQSYEVSGWRKSDTEVAAFTFAPLPDSYAARTGRPMDVGVIGVAAFQEKAVAQAQVSPPRPERRWRAAPPSAGLAAPESSADEAVVTGQKRQERLGTAHGAREWSLATTVTFERATRYPQQIRRIEYDTYERLVASGVVRPSWEAYRRPRAFPGSGGGYVPDPPGEY
jgi:hypothetical protein